MTEQEVMAIVEEAVKAGAYEVSPRAGRDMARAHVSTELLEQLLLQPRKVTRHLSPRIGETWRFWGARTARAAVRIEGQRVEVVGVAYNPVA